MNHKIKRPAPRVIRYEDLWARVSTGKFCEYRYRSPFYGYKTAWKYNKAVFIYLGSFEEGYLDVVYFRGNYKDVPEILRNFKETSIRYKRAIRKQQEGGNKNGS